MIIRVLFAVRLNRFVVNLAPSATRVFFVALSLRSGCLLAPWSACVVTPCPDVPAFVAFISSSSTLHDDGTTVAEERSRDSFGLMIGYPEFGGSGVGAVSAQSTRCR